MWFSIPVKNSEEPSVGWMVWLPSARKWSSGDPWKADVLISSGCHDKCHRLAALNTGHLLHYSFGGLSNVSASLVSMKPCPWLTDRTHVAVGSLSYSGLCLRGGSPPLKHTYACYLSESHLHMLSSWAWRGMAQFNL